MTINEMGEKVPKNAFKQPVFDWNISLATRFQKIQSQIEDNWQAGESDLHHSFQYLSHLNKTLQKSRVNLLFNPAFNGLNHGSFSSFNAYDSQHGSNAYMSPMSSNDSARSNQNLKSRNPESQFLMAGKRSDYNVPSPYGLIAAN